MQTPSRSLLQFLVRRALSGFASFLLITFLLYGMIMLTPAEARAQLFIPAGRGQISANFIPVMIREHHLDDPWLVQYGYWLKGLLSGDWGYSPTLHEDVLPALLSRTPVTLELALYSLLFVIPLGIRSGLVAGWRPGGLFDRIFRLASYSSLSIPPFILAMILIAIFYARLNWFPTGRLDTLLNMQVSSGSFHAYTGLMTVDAILNARLDVLFDALRHLVLPVFTLGLYYWATLGRTARAMMMGERRKEYLLAATAKGLAEHEVVWRHALRAIMAPALTTIALSAAAIVTGVYVVEVIFSLNGISNVIVLAMSSQPDAPAVLGFTVYSVILVVLLMFVLDVLQAWIDPRVRAETLTS